MLLFGCSLLKSRIITTNGIIQRDNHQKVKVTPAVESSFTPVYRFPYIPLCSMVAKYKKIQLGAFIIALPSSYFTYLAELCGEQLPIVVSTVGAVSTIAVFSVGQLFNGIVGAVYVSRSQKQVKIAYLNFWGKRQDIICKIEEITPIDESSSFTDIVYKNISTSVTDNPLKINLSVCEIVDNSLFRQVFF